jgi:AbrB family looped-hinge helix DNA binding protein
MRITSKGQVTIPQEIRHRLGLLPETEVAFDVVGNTARIRKVGGDRGEGGGSSTGFAEGRRRDSRPTRSSR